jgi:hypothetical protein
MHKQISAIHRTMASNPISGTEVNTNSGLPFGYVPAYLPGSASLVEELDEILMIVLRDGRHLVGVSTKRCVKLLPHRVGKKFMD